MSDTMRLKFVPRDGQDYPIQSVTDGEGYEFNFAPNQTLVVPTVAGNVAMSANATVSYGQDTAQATAPDVNIDAGSGTVPVI